MPVRYHQKRFPPEERLDWDQLIPQLGPSSAAVARYDAMLAAVQNPEALLASLTMREAVLSSRIEGTQATIAEVLEFEAGREPDSAARRDDIREVLSYRSAMSQAKAMLEKLPISQRVIRSAHTTLFSEAHGKGRNTPGEYRRVPNWIGSPGCSIDEARFVPIEANRLPDAMSAWERYLHDNTPDRLVQLAILHAEFESIHPFLDGNGRLGRMLVPLFLWQFNLIRAPAFYISAYFEARRDAYYDRLLAVSSNDDWTGWVTFFLNAVREQAEENLEKTKKIVGLYEETKTEMTKLTRSQYATLALDRMFEYPILSSRIFSAPGGVPKSSAKRVLRTLRDGGILRVFVPGRGRRSDILVFPALLNITEGREMF